MNDTTSYDPQAAFEALPDRVRQILTETFQRERDAAFSDAVQENYDNLVDRFLEMDDVASLWESYLEMQRGHWNTHTDGEAWSAFLNDALSDPALVAAAKTAGDGAADAMAEPVG